MTGYAEHARHEENARYDEVRERYAAELADLRLMDLADEALDREADEAEAYAENARLGDLR